MGSLPHALYGEWIEIQGEDYDEEMLDDGTLLGRVIRLADVTAGTTRYFGEIAEGDYAVL